MIQNEGRDISKDHLDDRATSTSCAVSSRHDAIRPARLAPRRPTLDVSIGACSSMPRNTLTCDCRDFWPTLWLAPYTPCRGTHHGRLGRPEAQSGFHSRALSGSGWLVHMTDMLAYMWNIY